MNAQATIHSGAPTAFAASPPQAPRHLWPAWPWLCLALLGTVDAIWIAATPLAVAPGTALALLQIVPLAAAAAILSRHLADRPRLYSLCAGGAFLFLAWPALRLFNHLTMTLGFPMADPLLSQWDRAIGFDWAAYVGWVDGYPGLIRLMDLSYGGLTGYSCALFLFLVAGPAPAQRCFELIVLFLATAVACSAIGLFFPALAAMAWYNPPAGTFEHFGHGTGTYHLAIIEQLRTNPTHAFDLNSLPGLVTFPSFHTAMGVVAIYCTRGTPRLFMPSLALNAVMIASTPVFGSHYGVDVIAGAAVAATAIMVLRTLRPAALSPNNTCRIRPGSESSPSAAVLPT